MEQQEEIIKDLTALCEKHGIKNAYLIGNTGTKFIGIPANSDDLFEVTLNIGRAWQSARETVKHELDKFEKSGK